MVSLDELRSHRFEAHPFRRPVMFLQGLELGTHPVRITRRISAADVQIADCDRVFFNGSEIPVSSLAAKLAKISLDVCRVVLINAGVEAEFELDIRVASKSDMTGIEKQFRRTSLGRRLDIRAVDEFIAATSEFRSAIGYCDGICEYLYGVLARERADDSSLPYEAYRGKFSKAAEELATYDRPLARIIVSLIEFHYNHFSESASQFPNSRVGSVAKRYLAWIESQKRVPAPVASADKSIGRLEALVTDWETEQILGWGVRPVIDLKKDVEAIELFLKRDLAEFDSVKLHILLGEIYAASGNPKRALEHAKVFRNLAALEEWAEILIQKVMKENK